MDSSFLDTELIDVLRARGQRVTLPRLLVHRHVREAQRHVTAEQVYAELAGELPSLSPATVYSTLDLLDELGFVRRMNTPRGAIMYDSRVDDHHHVICRHCGRMQDVDVAIDTRAAERAASAAGFEVGHAQLTLSGLCSDCARAKMTA
jgi:Fe2+ or Zn2+ uptake regulation protein